MRQPILITGAARSGTSMVAGIIDVCGAFGGKMFPGNRYNHKGMFENEHIREKIVKPYLISIGADPFCQYPLIGTKGIRIPDDFQNQVEQTMLNDGYEDGEWFYKCPKLSHMWPVWNHAFPGAKYIIVRRRTGDIVTSCLKTGFMRAFSREHTRKAINVKTEVEGWQWWVHQHEARFVEMITEGLNCKIVWPDRMVQGDYAQIQEMIEWVGLEWKEKEVKEFIDPKLWKSRQMLIKK
jgi:hypothetical protein